MASIVAGFQCVLLVRREYIEDLKNSLLGVLFLLINEKMRSSPAFEYGIVRITSATLNKRSFVFKANAARFLYIP